MGYFLKSCAKLSTCSTCYIPTAGLRMCVPYFEENPQDPAWHLAHSKFSKHYLLNSFFLGSERNLSKTQVGFSDFPSNPQNKIQIPIMAHKATVIRTYLPHSLISAAHPSRILLCSQTT